MQSGDESAERAEADRAVDETIDESFPASDPPSFWAGDGRHHGGEAADTGELDEADVTPDPDRVEEGFTDDDHDEHESGELEDDDMLLPPTPEPPSRR